MAFTEYVPNDALASVMDECLSEIGAPAWTDEDMALARSFLDSYNDEVKKGDKEGDLRALWRGQGGGDTGCTP